MGQFLKDHIRQSIIDAALQEFAAQGYAGASIAEIAHRAGVSTGNVYRYFTNKAKLFDAAIPKSFVERLLKKLRKRVASYPAGTPPDSIPKHSPYHVLSEELLEFVIENRLRVLIVLDGSKGSVYEPFSSTLRVELTKNAMHAFRLASLMDHPAIINPLIEELYGNFLHAIGTILRQFSDPSDIHTAMRFLTTYHLSGLAMLCIRPVIH